MHLRVGYELIYRFQQPTAVILVLNIHYSRASDIVRPDHIVTAPGVPVASYRDMFGNWCTRIVAPAGRIRISADAIIAESGIPDVVVPGAQQVAVPAVPDDALVFLLGSRYCETDRLLEVAWSLFGATPPGWARVQAICDFVHNHVTFDYAQANPTKSAWDVFHGRQGVCRDFAHLAVAFCRCMNIPARYCTGYLGDVGVPPPHGTMDFAAWFEAYLGGSWYTFDPRNNVPRLSRVLIARGRDAADVAIATTFGVNTLEGFRVWTDEIPSPV